jgi:hypothetical protein
MVPLIVTTLVLLPVFYCVSLYRRLQANIQAAKASGVPYVVLPIYSLNRVWLTTCHLWLPLLRKLPSSWTKNRIE